MKKMSCLTLPFTSFSHMAFYMEKSGTNKNKATNKAPCTRGHIMKILLCRISEIFLHMFPYRTFMLS